MHALLRENEGGAINMEDGRLEGASVTHLTDRPELRSPGYGCTNCHLDTYPHSESHLRRYPLVEVPA